MVPARRVRWFGGNPQGPADGLEDFLFGEVMKRRQPGILTGMPFMANLADQTFVDDLGRRVYLSKPPRRVVSLAPSVTEILFAVGLDAEVGGVTTFCDYPAKAKTRPKGGAAIPHPEAILGLKPDLVVGTGSIRQDVLAKLEQLKTPVFVLSAKTLEDVLGHISTVGRMVGQEREARRGGQGRRDRPWARRPPPAAGRGAP